MSAPVGADIESICRKCGDVWHVVVAKVGDNIAQVLCKQCNGKHKYKPPGGKSGSRSSSVRSRSRTSSSARGTASTASRRVDEPQVEPNDKPRVPYKYSETYEPGDRIDHPKFGFGVVEITSEPGKMQVFFPDGRRVLALAKKASTLTRPDRTSAGGQEPPKW